MAITMFLCFFTNYALFFKRKRYYLNGDSASCREFENRERGGKSSNIKLLSPPYPQQLKKKKSISGSLSIYEGLDHEAL